jgi:predicted membrane protein
MTRHKGKGGNNTSTHQHINPSTLQQDLINTNTLTFSITVWKSSAVVWGKVPVTGFGISIYDASKSSVTSVGWRTKKHLWRVLFLRYLNYVSIDSNVILSIFEFFFVNCTNYMKYCKISLNHMKRNKSSRLQSFGFDALFLKIWFLSAWRP